MKHSVDQTPSPAFTDQLYETSTANVWTKIHKLIIGNVYMCWTHVLCSLKWVSAASVFFLDTIPPRTTEIECENPTHGGNNLQLAIVLVLKDLENTKKYVQYRPYLQEQKFLESKIDV